MRRSPEKWQSRFMLDLLVLGDSAWDTVVRIAEPLRFNGDIGAAIQGSPGGQGLNAATAARKEGATVGLITQLGTDAQSDALLQRMTEMGIHPLALTRQDPLTQVVAIVRPDGERALLTEAGSGPMATPPLDITAQVLVISGYLLDRPGGPQRMEAWAWWARSRHMTVICDPSHPQLAPKLLPVLRQAHWLVPNLLEWQALGQTFSGSVLLKRGAEGADLIIQGEVRQIPSPPGPIVDTTGAGDAVLGSFAALLALGLPPLEAARQAVVRGWSACAHMGAV